MKSGWLIIDEKGEAFGDSDRKIIVLSSAKSFMNLSKKLLVAKREVAFGERLCEIGGEKEGIEELVFILDKKTFCYIENGVAYIHLSKRFLPNFCVQLNNLASYGSYIVVEPDFEGEKYPMECFFSHFRRDT